MIQRYCTFEPPKHKQVKWSKDVQLYHAQGDTPFQHKLDMIKTANEIVVPVDWLHYDEMITQVCVADQLGIDIYAFKDDELEKIELETCGAIPYPSEVVEDG